MYQCINMKTHVRQREHQSADGATSAPLAAITTSKHLLHPQGQKGFPSKSHTEWFAAFVVTGCVKCNAIIFGVLVSHS